MTPARKLAAFALLVLAPRLFAQERGAAALGEAIAGLGTTTRVLMIGAHPDDEDTQLIAFLAKGRHIETAYLSLTRGDGGQNLIGNELGEALGMIRTEELLAARRLDGGRQYFTRAFDFGFSKTLAETQRHWPTDSILEDMVAIVRAFRPHVIISVWSGTPADGHGHHQDAGVLARMVYDAAPDTVRFPRARSGGLAPWAPLKFYRLRRGGGGNINYDVGEYDPLLGESYSEIATVSRSQHRSQGQGALPVKGPRFSGVALEASRVSDPNAREETIFDGIDTSWTRFKALPLPADSRSALDSLVVAQAAVVAVENLRNPTPLVAPLANYLRLATRAATGVTCATLEYSLPTQPCDPGVADLSLALRTTRERATDALLDAAGVDVGATATRELIAEGDTVPVTISVYNRGRVPVELLDASLLGTDVSVGSPRQILAAHRILPDSAARQTLIFRAPRTISMPWWLRSPRVGDMFTQPIYPMIVGEDRLADTGAEVELRIDGVSVPVRVAPIVYRFADRAIGEVRRPIAVVPEIVVLLQHEVEYARANAPFDRTMLVNVHSSASTPRNVDVTLHLPSGLTADSAMRRVSLAAFGDANLYFRVRGRLPVGRAEISATASDRGRQFTVGFVPIEYSHIRPLRYYRAASEVVEAVNATYANLKIGYVPGVGDNVMPMLSELGLSVTQLDPLTLPQTNLSQFSTIVLGPRAYEANPALVANNSAIMNFVRSGGTVVTQYGQAEYGRAGILPYMISAPRAQDRVTDEGAPVRVLDPGSPLLARPNRIGDADFAGWVQERATYMPRSWDNAYRTVLSMNDPNDPPQDAGILVAPLGRGTYVYTTLAFFRQLPAGNPGAARLFINLLSAKQDAANRPRVPPSSPPRP